MERLQSFSQRYGVLGPLHEIRREQRAHAPLQQQLLAEIVLDRASEISHSVEDNRLQQLRQINVVAGR
jgi:hypothetical protein